METKSYNYLLPFIGRNIYIEKKQIDEIEVLLQINGDKIELKTGGINIGQESYVNYQFKCSYCNSNSLEDISISVDLVTNNVKRYLRSTKEDYIIDLNIEIDADDFEFDFLDDLLCHFKEHFDKNDQCGSCQSFDTVTTTSTLQEYPSAKKWLEKSVYCHTCKKTSQ